MGQLTLLKNVPESGGGGFEKLWEDEIPRTVTPYNSYSFPNLFDGNFLDFDLLFICLSNVTAPNTNDLRGMIYISFAPNSNPSNQQELTVMELDASVRNGEAMSFFSIITTSNLPSERKILTGLQSYDTGANSSMDEFDLSNLIYDTNVNKLNYIKISTQADGGIASGAKVTIYGMGKRK